MTAESCGTCLRRLAWVLWYRIVEPVNYWLRGPRPISFRLKLWRRIDLCGRCGRRFRYFSEPGCWTNVCGYCGLRECVEIDVRGTQWMNTRFKRWLVG